MKNGKIFKKCFTPSNLCKLLFWCMRRLVAAFKPSSKFQSPSALSCQTMNILSMGRKLTEIADRMADYGVPMVYHHHMGTVIETEREVDLLMANTGPNVNLLDRHRTPYFRRWQCGGNHSSSWTSVETCTLQRHPCRCLQKSSGRGHELPRRRFWRSLHCPRRWLDRLSQFAKVLPISTTVVGL